MHKQNISPIAIETIERGTYSIPKMSARKYKATLLFEKIKKTARKKISKLVKLKSSFFLKNRKKTNNRNKKEIISLIMISSLTRIVEKLNMTYLIT